MLLGLIAILVFFFHESNLSEKISHLMARAFPISVGPGHPAIICSEEDLNVLFEKVHLGISATMGIYFLTCIYLVMLHWIIYKHWIRIDYESFDTRLYDRTITAHQQSHWFLRYLHLPRQWRLWRLHGIDRIHALRAACIEQYGLPQDFQFSKYFKLSMRDVVIHVLEVHPICWAILVVALLFTLARTFIKLRVNDSVWTIVIYGSLSLCVSALSATIYIITARIYRKVLALPSVRRHLHTKAASFDDHFEPTALSSNYDEEADDSPLLGSMKDSSSGPFLTSFELTKDDEEPAFEHIGHGKTLQFQVFKSLGDNTVLMSVDSYRESAARVTRILRRSQTPTVDDQNHKSWLFFRSTRFLIAAVQVITFLQTWLLGLSIYYVYSIYKDVPRDPPKHPAIVLYVFLGPLITYGLMGPTLSKIVKASYTGGCIRPELILECLFLPKSRHHPNTSKTGAQRAYEERMMRDPASIMQVDTFPTSAPSSAHVSANYDSSTTQLDSLMSLETIFVPSSSSSSQITTAQLTKVGSLSPTHNLSGSEVESDLEQSPESEVEVSMKNTSINSLDNDVLD
jgi:hypothetical protein